MERNNLFVVRKMQNVLNQIKGFDAHYSVKMPDKLFVSFGDSIYKMRVELLAVDSLEHHEIMREMDKLIKKEEVLKEERDEMYDQIISSYASIFNTEPSDKVVVSIGNLLPAEIKDKAKQWDWNDTEVRDEVYVWIRDNVSGDEKWKNYTRSKMLKVNFMIPF